MNKYLILLIASLFFSSIGKAQEMYRVTADKLNVRETKDPNSKKIGFIPQNENVAVIDSSDVKYFKIKVTNGEGWVSKEYLQRVNAPTAKQAVLSNPVVEQKTKQDYSTITFITLVMMVMIILLFIIIKFIPNNVFKIFSAAMVIIIGYFFYLGFIVEKTVSGKYNVIDSDAQYQSFDFKSNHIVVIEDNYLDSLTTATYSIEEDMIKFKQQENTFILLIRDNNTLVGEGFTKGIFRKTK